MRIAGRSGTVYMGIRLPSISVSKYTVIFASQLVVNVSLAVWLYNEYIHNPFGQAYMSDMWSTIWPGIMIIIGAAIGVAVVFGLYRRGRLPKPTGSPPRTAVQAVSRPTNLEALDSCPFCDVPLKTISTGRLQCRNCRRYFKSSNPK